jgi:hypothetical protein
MSMGSTRKYIPVYVMLNSITNSGQLAAYIVDEHVNFMCAATAGKLAKWSLFLHLETVII